MLGGGSSKDSWEVFFFKKLPFSIYQDTHFFYKQLKVSFQPGILRQSRKFSLKVGKGLLRYSKTFLTTNIQMYFIIMKTMFISEMYTDKLKQNHLFWLNQLYNVICVKVFMHFHQNVSLNCLVLGESQPHQSLSMCIVFDSNISLKPLVAELFTKQ